MNKLKTLKSNILLLKTRIKKKDKIKREISLLRKQIGKGYDRTTDLEIIESLYSARIDGCYIYDEDIKWLHYSITDDHEVSFLANLIGGEWTMSNADEYSKYTCVSLEDGEESTYSH